MLIPKLYIRVGPIAFSILLATLETKLITLVTAPCPLVALLVGKVVDSTRGLVNCKPTCLTINKGPLGKTVRNLPIRSVSVIAALVAPIIPPLINPSSNLVSLTLLIVASIELMSVLI